MRVMVGISWVASREELLESGLSRRGLTAALRAGHLIRARRDHYVSAAAPIEVIQAVRVGGRVACVSLLRLLGVFVFESSHVHVHTAVNAARLRSPVVIGRPLEPRTTRPARVHWAPLLRPEDAAPASVGIWDAVLQAVRCQAPRHAIASLDSALNKRLISGADLDQLFRALPARFGVLRPMIDGRAQAGTETLVRLMVVGLGCRVELQVHLEGVGYVDLLVEGWLIVECDSRAFHDTWEQRVKDHRRDLTAAALGYLTLRLTAADILYHPESVLSALRGVLRNRRPRGPASTDGVS